MVAAVLLVAFVVIETRVEAPLMPLRIFKLKTLAGANVVGFLLGASFFAFIFVGTLYMQQVLHYSAIETGLAWLATSVTSVAFAGLSQALVTRRSPKLVMALGMAMIGAGLLWTSQAGHGHYLTSLFGPFFIAGVGTAFAFIPISIAALAGVEEHEAGLASGLINTTQQLGGAIGVAVASTVTATHLEDTGAPGRLRPGRARRRPAVGVLGDRRHGARRCRRDLRARSSDRPRASRRSHNLTRYRLGGRHETSAGPLHRQARPRRRERAAGP